MTFRAIGWMRSGGMMFPGKGSRRKRPGESGSGRMVAGSKIWYCGPRASSSEKSPPLVAGPVVEEVAGVELRPPVPLVQLAVERVGAALGHDIHPRAHGEAEGRVVGRGLDPELLDEASRRSTPAAAAVTVTSSTMPPTSRAMSTVRVSATWSTTPVRRCVRKPSLRAVIR